MSIETTLICDRCKKRCVLLDNQESPGAELFLEVTDANHVKHQFCGIEHLRQWAATYVCPYRRSAATPIRRPGAPNGNS